MGVIEAILYGIVQGITEWLPISSTAHLRILPALLHQPDPGAAFTAVIQLGTTLAVIIFFRKDLGQAIKAWFNSLRGIGKDTVEAKIGWGVFYGSLPIVILGFLLKGVIKSDGVRSLYVIAGTLIVNGILMAIAERVQTKRRTMEEVTVRDGFIVGLWQALALLPGMSRSGSTIAGGLFAGLDRTAAARFSFLLSVPSIAAAGFYELFQERKHILGSQLTPTLIATVVSFVVGYASIAWLIKYIAKKGFTIFVIYRIALGLVLLGLIAAGTIAPVSESPDQAKAETPVP
ncbi:undecaprenyl-diphosphate phosphatase [bacterium]|nr:MAG: undecaprenyl-diphosphate phosphatase [bacterium]